MKVQKDPKEARERVKRLEAMIKDKTAPVGPKKRPNDNKRDREIVAQARLELAALEAAKKASPKKKG